MATSSRKTLVVLQVFVCVLAFSVADNASAGRKRGKLMTYWGQNVGEGTLKAACQTGTYDIIAMSFVAVFGNNAAPQLNLAGHCTPELGECTKFTSDIHFCQSSGVKILLSLGGGAGSYAIISDADAHSVAKYVWNNYLGGRSKSRPLGPAVLDGVDLDIEASASPYWASLAKHLKGYSSRILLTAAPQCPFPDVYVGPGPHTALQTGLFDYAWVQFYNNPPCDYGGSSINGILDAWKQWANHSVPGNTRIFLGLPATPDAAPSGGFLPPKVLKAQVLPRIKKSRMYGGVMLWSRYYDRMSHFGASIKHSL